MREIKFRAWHKSDEVMLNVFAIDWHEKYIAHDPVQRFVEMIEVYPRYEMEGASDLKEVKLMQYTGIKDKEGKEIYDGDILRIEYHDDEAPDVYVGDFEFSEGCYGMNVQATHTHSKHFSPFNEQARPEVIGNIYENPDLAT